MFALAQNYLTRGFWGDEAWTSLISQLPYLQMLKTTAADFHPPAYYTIVELWYKIFPATEVSTRLISLIFYFLTVFAVYKLVFLISTSEEPKLTSEVSKGETGGLEPTTEVTRKKRFWGLISATVVLVNPIFFTYAFEARNYTMFAFAATGSIYFLLKFLTSSNIKNGLLFVLFTTLGIYTHYYMFFVLATEFLYILFFVRKTLSAMIMVYFVIGLLYLPWIPFLFAQLKSVGGGYWIGTIDLKHTHREALMRILGGETPGLLQLWLYRFSLILMAVGLIQHLWKRSFGKSPLRPFDFAQDFEGRAYILIWLWAVVPFVLATLPGLNVDGFKLPFRPIFFWRYLIPAAVPLAILIVYASQKLPNVLFKISLAVVIVLSLVIDYLTFFSYQYNFKQAYSQKVIPIIRSSDKIVTVLPSFAEVFYYRNRFGLKNDVIVLPEGLVQFSGKSLLDAYAKNGAVRIEEPLEGSYFELSPGPTVLKVEVGE